MEYLEKVLKKTGLSSLLISIIFAILGIVLIKNPDETVKFISYILGITFMMVGLYKIIIYLRNKNKFDFYNYDMTFGIIAIILGVVTIVYSKQIGALFRILIGLWIVYSSIIRIDLAYKLKLANLNVWIYSFILAIAMLLCGMFIIFNSGVIIMTIGIVILVYSVLDIAENLIFLKNVSNLSKVYVLYRLFFLALKK